MHCKICFQTENSILHTRIPHLICRTFKIVSVFQVVPVITYFGWKDCWWQKFLENIALVTLRKDYFDDLIPCLGYVGIHFLGIFLEDCSESNRSGILSSVTMVSALFGMRAFKFHC